MTTSSPDTPSRSIRLWDLPLRIFHWTLVLVVAGAILSVELADQISNGMEWHKRLGIAALALILFRLVWGFVGSTHARFASFVKGPKSIIAYLKNMKNEKGPSIGHNPLGALSVLALLATLLFQAGSGLFITDEIMLEGPLFKYVSEKTASLLAQLHEANGNLIIALIGLHFAAIIFYRVVKRDNLITPMIIGRKAVPADSPVQDARGGHALLGLAIFAIAAGAVYYIATQL